MPSIIKLGFNIARNCVITWQNLETAIRTLVKAQRRMRVKALARRASAARQALPRS